MKNEKKSAFSMSSQARKHIESKGLYALVMETKSPMSKVFLVIGAIVILVAAALAFFGTNIIAGIETDDVIAVAVLGLVLLLLGPLIGVIKRKSSVTRKAGLSLMEQYYGESADVILKKIDGEVRSYPGHIPATQNKGYFTQNWYVAPNFWRFVELSDIACVIGIMGKGTFVIPTHGDEIDDMFGGNPNWGMLFHIIETANPHVLSHDDYIILDGKQVQIYDAVDAVISSMTKAGQEKKRKVFDAIVKEFISRIEVQETTQP